jgi:hypothetical protein
VHWQIGDEIFAPYPLTQLISALGHVDEIIDRFSGLFVLRVIFAPGLFPALAVPAHKEHHDDDPAKRCIIAVTVLAMDIQSDPVRADSSAHHARQSRVEERVAASGLCQAAELGMNAMVNKAPVFSLGAARTVAEAFFCDEGEGAHQAAFGLSGGTRPRIGRLRTQRRSSSGSISVCLPAFRAVKVPSRIASKMRVRLTPALSAASSGLNPSRGMCPAGWIDSIMHLLRSAECRRPQSDALKGERNIPEIFYFFSEVLRS